MATHILLDDGSGGNASQRLIAQVFQRHFDNAVLNTMDDAATLHINGPLALSTDSYTVTPLFFPGGSIGTLAVHGTVNDVAMLGARPQYLTCACILEEGLPLDTLNRIVADMAQAAREADVCIVTGDTKVVPHGACDKIFINTTGIGTICAHPAPSGHRAVPGDAVLISGTLGDHGVTIMAQREGLDFATNIASDSAPLHGLVMAMLKAVGTQGDLHVLRDPTRGGLATTLNEIAVQSGVGIVLHEPAVPVRESVRSVCALLGLDPLYLANEGKCVVIVPEAQADTALAAMRAHQYGREAARVGTVLAPQPGLIKAGQVALETAIGGRRLLAMLEGAQLPRIC